MLGEAVSEKKKGSRRKQKSTAKKSTANRAVLELGDTVSTFRLDDRV
jgi:hypothetical protein